MEEGMERGRGMERWGGKGGRWVGVSRGVGIWSAVEMDGWTGG